MSVESNRLVLEASLHFWFSARNELMESEPLQRELARGINQLSHEDAGRLAETACHIFNQKESDIVTAYAQAAGYETSPAEDKILKATEILAKLLDTANAGTGVKGIMPSGHKSAAAHMAFAEHGLSTLAAACTPKGM